MIYKKMCYQFVREVKYLQKYQNLRFSLGLTQNAIIGCQLIK